MSSRLDRRDDWERLAALCDYRVEDLARFCRVSRRQLQRFFWHRFRKTPKHWLDEQRAHAAAAEIARGELVKTAASDLKFTKASTFTRFFKRVEGMPPKDYGLRKDSQIVNRKS